MSPTSTLARSARRLSRLLLPAFAVLLLAAMWVAVLNQISLERTAAYNNAAAYSQSLARVLSEHVRYILRQSDHAAELFKLRYEETGGALRLPEFERPNGLLDSVLPARLHLPMAIIDRYGKRVDSANGYHHDDVAGQGFFQALAAADANAEASVFSAPVVDAASGKWQIQVARRLVDHNGHFAGVILIMIDPMVFIDDYDRVNLSEMGTIMLVNRSAGLSVGRVGDQLFFSKQVAFAPGSPAGSLSGELIASSPIDQIPRIYSASDMPRFSLTAVVGIAAKVAMAKFEGQRTMALWVSFGASWLIIAIVALLIKQSMRLRSSMGAAREAQATLRAATQGSLDGFMILTAWKGKGRDIADYLIADINERGAALFQSTRQELLGQKLFGPRPQLGQTGFLASYARAQTSGAPIEQESELRINDEPPRWIRQQVVPLRDGVAVTLRDITMRKLAEFEIHANRSFLQSLIDHLPLLIYVKCLCLQDMGRMMVWNKAAEAVTGYQATRVLGQIDTHVFPADFALCNAEQDRAMLDAPLLLDLPEIALTLADGSVRYLHTVSVPLLDDTGDHAEYVLCIAEDITERREQERQLRASEAQLNAVTGASPLGLMRTDLGGNCTYVNRRFEIISGLSCEHAKGRGWLMALHPDDRGYLQDVLTHQRHNQEPFQQVVRCRHPDGKLVWASLKVAAVRVKGRIEGFVASIDDITTLREAEMALRESEARLRTIADTLPAMVAYIDAEQIYRFHNLAYDREFGRNGGAVPGTTILATIGEERYRVLEPFITRALAGATVSFEEHDERNGHERTLEVTYIPQLDDNGHAVLGFHVIRQDVSSQNREKKRLLKLAQIDPLTGLANRAGFLQKLETVMQESLEHGHLMAIMYMDIDHFKPVNDTHGHDVGDALLKAFSKRLIQTLRASDTIARLGGDEFTIIMETLSRPQDAAALAAKIVGAMRAPFELNGVSVSVSASIGLAYYNDDTLDADGLLKQADIQLYEAKQAGRNTYRVAA